MNYITIIKTVFILLPTFICSLEALENKCPVSTVTALQSDCAAYQIGLFHSFPANPANDIEDPESSELFEGENHRRARRSKNPYSSAIMLWSMPRLYCSEITINRNICCVLQSRYDFASLLRSVILRL